MWSQLSRDIIICVLHCCVTRDLAKTSAHLNKAWNNIAKIRRAWKYAIVKPRPHEVYTGIIQNVFIEDSCSTWSGHDILSLSLRNFGLDSSHFYSNRINQPSFRHLQEFYADFRWFGEELWSDISAALPVNMRRLALKRLFNEQTGISLARFADSLEQLTLESFEIIDTPVLGKLTHLTLERARVSGATMIAPNLTSVTLKNVTMQANVQMTEFFKASALADFTWGFRRHAKHTSLAAERILPLIAPSVASLYFMGTLQNVSCFSNLRTAAVNIDHISSMYPLSAPQLSHLKLIAGVATKAFIYYYESIAAQLQTLTIFVPVNSYLLQFLQKCCNLKIIRTNAQRDYLSQLRDWADPRVRIFIEYPCSNNDGIL